MEQSLFIKWVNKFFPGIVIKVTSTLNDEKRQPSYLHKTMLRREFSISGKWESINEANSLVAADVVAMDSPLPLKTRPSISKASGDVPKIGMELKLNENQLTALDLLVKSGATDAQIVAKLFADTPRVIAGINERLEQMFLEGLSSGVTLVDTDNVGTGIRLDFGYPTANKFKTKTAVWTSPSTATPITDLNQLIDAASTKGDVLAYVMMDKTTFNNMKASAEGKDLYATSIGNFGNTKPVPSREQFMEAFEAETGLKIIIVDRSVRTEKDGTATSAKPWAVGQVVALTSLEVGQLVWAELAEMNHPVEGVSYQRADGFILVSKYRANKPSLSEWTSSQARVVPVITGVDSIYVLDTTTVNE